MESFISNWVAVVMLLLIACTAAIFIFKFLTSPKDEQLEAVKEWLLWAVTEAEKEFGSGTGKLKLRSVYDKFVNTFPWLADVITFDKFSIMVDESLVVMNELLASNKAIKEYVEGTDPIWQ